MCNVIHDYIIAFLQTLVSFVSELIAFLQKFGYNLGKDQICAKYMT